MIDPNASHPERFMGMTKLQYGLLVVALVMAALGGQVYIIYKNTELSRSNVQLTHKLAATQRRDQRLALQGAQTHVAVCAYKANLEGQVTDSKNFLLLTYEQLVQKYGIGLANEFKNVPKATFRQSLAKERAAVASLGALKCP